LKANILNNYFGSVCTVDNGNKPSVRRVVPDSVGIGKINFSPMTVLRAINKIKSNTSSGPDGFPPRPFKMLASSLADPLSMPFSSFMSIGQVPETWKTAIVAPIYKKGLASEPSNYRPISLTSVVYKLMERIIASDLMLSSSTWLT
jgi:hypothetical protein